MGKGTTTDGEHRLFGLRLVGVLGASATIEQLVDLLVQRSLVRLIG
jgi:hypothetical protein